MNKYFDLAEQIIKSDSKEGKSFKGFMRGSRGDKLLAEYGYDTRGEGSSRSRGRPRQDAILDSNFDGPISPQRNLRIADRPRSRTPPRSRDQHRRHRHRRSRSRSRSTSFDSQEEYEQERRRRRAAARKRAGKRDLRARVEEGEDEEFEDLDYPAADVKGKGKAAKQTRGTSSLNDYEVDIEE